MPPCSGSPRLTKLAHGYDAAGILVLHDSKVTTLAPTHQLVIDSDRLQECFDAARSGQGERVFRIADSPTSTSAYAPRPVGSARAA